MLGGVAVFVAGQFILKWMIEPLQEEYKELKGEISYALLYYANILADYASPGGCEGTRTPARARWSLV